MTNQPVEVQELDQFTPEEIAEAEIELQDISPEKYLVLTSRVNQETEALLASLSSMPEAGAVVFCKLINAKGQFFHLTGRGPDCVTAIKNLAAGVKFAKATYGWTVVQEGSVSGPFLTPPPARQTPPPPAVGQKVVPPVGGQKVAPPLKQAAPPEPTYQDEDGGHSASQPTKTGTNILNSIKVDDGKVEFSVGKFQYPFPDLRGVDKVIEVFDPEIGFTVDHLIDGAKYDPSQWDGVLYVDWEAVVKFSKAKKKDVTYYNVIRVHK